MENTNHCVMDVQDDLPAILKKAANLLDKGNIVVVPSETVYGLAGSIYSKEAIEKIYRVKNRPMDNPLINHISQLEQLFLLSLPSQGQKNHIEKLIQNFWPGPLTIILPKNPDTLQFNYAAQGFDTVAIRMPSHKIFRELLDYIGYPLAAPSANISGRPSGTHVEDISREFSAAVPLIIKDKPSFFGLESTVLDLTQEKPVILRPGSISLEELQTVLPETVLDQSMDVQKDIVKSPGQKYKHYQPSFPVYLWKEQLPISSESSFFKHRAIITHNPHLKEPLSLYGKVWVYKDLTVFARDLYHLLYALELEGYKELFIQVNYPAFGVATALLERIERMASTYP